MRFSQQVYQDGLPFPPPADHVLLEYSAVTHPSWMALHGMAHSFIELCRLLHHYKAVIHEYWSGLQVELSCLENPRDGRAWWAAIYGVAQSRTQLMRLSSSSSMH